MIKILTAGEEDGRRSNPIVSDQMIQTDQPHQTVDSLIMQDNEMEVINIKVQGLEEEIERLNIESEEDRKRFEIEIDSYKRDIQRYKDEVLKQKDSKEEYIKQVAALTSETVKFKEEAEKLEKYIRYDNQNWETKSKEATKS